MVHTKASGEQINSMPFFVEITGFLDKGHTEGNSRLQQSI